MRRYSKPYLIAALVAPFLVVSVAAAAVTPQTASPKVAATTTVPTAEPTATGPEDKALLQRLEQRKARLKTKITALEQQKIQLKCKPAQGLLRSLSGRIKGIETSRAEVYGNLLDRLTKMSTQLKAGNVGTSSLDTEITELQAKITTFNTDMASYKLTVSDLSVMDCAKDPTAFRATLELARAAHDTANKDSADIRNYVTATIKPTLVELRKQLDNKVPSETGNN